MAHHPGQCPDSRGWGVGDSSARPSARPFKFSLMATAVADLAAYFSYPAFYLFPKMGFLLSPYFKSPNSGPFPFLAFTRARLGVQSDGSILACCACRHAFLALADMSYGKLNCCLPDGHVMALSAVQHNTCFESMTDQSTKYNTT